MAAVATTLAVLTPLLLLDGPDRARGFRIGVALVAAFTLRAVGAATAEANAAPADSPFARRRARSGTRWRLRPTPKAARRSSADALVLAAMAGAGGFHHRLRPALLDIADERLRARHGVGIDDPAAADRLGPVAWDLLRPGRRPPGDRRAPGPDEATMDRVLAAIEGL
jgi:hypothetical protein